MRKEQISAKIATVKAELMQIGAMRPGTLSQQYSACQKPGRECIFDLRHCPFRGHRKVCRTDARKSQIVVKEKLLHGLDFLVGGRELRLQFRRF